MSARLVLLASGGGRTVENLAQCIQQGELAAEIIQVVASRKDAGVVERCQGLGLPIRIFGKETHADPQQRDADLLAFLTAQNPDWIVLAGWLQLFPLLPEWQGKVINIHPALLPSFGGKSFYGKRVHQAVLQSGMLWSGCTVHFVDAEYDRGVTILQEAVPVPNPSTVQKLADRVFEVEQRVLPEAIRHLIAGRAQWHQGKILWS